MSDESVRSLVEGFYRSRLANDVDRCLSDFAPGAVCRIAGSPKASSIATTSNNAESPCQLISELVATWEWRAQQIESLTIDGERVAAHYRLEAKFIPTGDMVRSEVMDVLTLRNGKILSLVEFVDTALVANLAAKVAMTSAV